MDFRIVKAANHYGNVLRDRLGILGICLCCVAIGIVCSSGGATADTVDGPYRVAEMTTTVDGKVYPQGIFVIECAGVDHDLQCPFGHYNTKAEREVAADIVYVLNAARAARIKGR